MNWFCISLERAAQAFIDNLHDSCCPDDLLGGKTKIPDQKFSITLIFI
jgi:hypothetical protein